MKRIIIFLVVLFSAITFNAEAKKHYNGVGGYFYSELAPYGNWIEVDYGVVVWRPTIIRVDWMPYQTGRWVSTYDGWYWDSYEPFGFITYHYGRWYYDDYYGWLWYPDYEWAPAWVEWRYDNNYIGWAPLHPYATFSISVGIYWNNVYYTPYYHWNYVTYNHFCDPYVYNYYVESGYKYRIHGETKYRNNYGYRNGRVQNRGVDIDYISNRSGQQIKQRDIIRVNDSKNWKRDNFKKNDQIRTLDLNRNELVKNDLSRMEVKRENKHTSLDIEKVQIGKRENVQIEKRDVKSRDKNIDTRNDKNIRTNKNVEINQKKNENITRNEKEVVVQYKNKTANIKDLTRENQQRTKEVKDEDTRVKFKDYVKKDEVREQKRNDVREEKTTQQYERKDKTTKEVDTKVRNRK